MRKKPTLRDYLERVNELYDINTKTGTITNKRTKKTNYAVSPQGYRFLGVRFLYTARGVVRPLVKIFLVHQLVFWKKYGYIPENIDHINNIKLDNRAENLQAITLKNNIRKQKLRCNNTSGYKGVYRRKYGKYCAQISVDNKKMFLGTFIDPKDAARAYDKAAKHYYENFAITNVDLGLL